MKNMNCCWRTSSMLHCISTFKVIHFTSWMVFTFQRGKPAWFFLFRPGANHEVWIQRLECFYFFFIGRSRLCLYSQMSEEQITDTLVAVWTGRSASGMWTGNVWSVKTQEGRLSRVALELGDCIKVTFVDNISIAISFTGITSSTR